MWKYVRKLKGVVKPWDCIIVLVSFFTVNFINPGRWFESQYVKIYIFKYLNLHTLLI